MILLIHFLQAALVSLPSSPSDSFSEIDEVFLSKGFCNVVSFLELKTDKSPLFISAEAEKTFKYDNVSPLFSTERVKLTLNLRTNYLNKEEEDHLKAL